MGWFAATVVLLNLFGPASRLRGQGWSRHDQGADCAKANKKQPDWIDGHSKKMNQLLEGCQALITGEIGKTLVALGDENLKSFDPGSVRALGQMLRRVLLPALGAAIRSWARCSSS